MKKAYILFAAITLLLFVVVLRHTPQQAGDIVEYFGTTQSLLSHGGVNLTAPDRLTLENVLHPAYFDDPQYYVVGRGESRYPVHFVLYSVLAVPIYVVLQIMGANLLLTLPLLNWLILTFTALAMLRLMQKSPKLEANHAGGVQARSLSFFLGFAFLTLLYLSPMLSFLVWPGPDMLYMCLLLLAIFSFFEEKFLWAALLSAIASWHSQPLMFLALFFIGYYGYVTLQNRGKHVTYSPLENAPKIQNTIYKILPVLFLTLLIAIPYIYNLYAFGVLTPWTQFENGWTRAFGFGFHNASLKKLFEQFFDLNMGLFWYTPVLFVAGLAGFIYKARSSRLTQIVGAVFLLTCFAYQTNPAWHYGTAGYGPGRHALFAIAFLIYFAGLLFARFRKIGYVLLTLFVVTQIYVHSFNGWATPNFEKVLQHSPYAIFVLDRAPFLYNPTPEIFADRTNHTDVDHPVSAIYFSGITCKKAYVLPTDIQRVIDACGSLPENSVGIVDNEFNRKANYTRTIKTNEATLWPDSQSCENGFIHDAQRPYICLKTKDDVKKMAGVNDVSRITTVPDYEYTGIWKIKNGKPIDIIIPPGYIVDYNATEGIYINF